ncbi:hypothetical protein HF680_13870 [Brevundimonas sp. WCHBH090558]|uniref:hypothetical protein n=1 Tax=Brevundimonas huaxiensis TaxID=2725493 RepID=UPI001629D8F9|nr:hypothetical protein [Brevundimonas huaxiensis]MBC1183737.1 hypothetical protein [Brevundimonas huaxiensis]
MSDQIDQKIRELQYSVARLTAVQRAGVAGDEAVSFALVHGVYPVMHDGNHAEFSDQFSVSRESMNRVRNGLLDGTVKSAMDVERLFDHEREPNFKIAAGFVLRYFFLSGLEMTDRKWADFGLTTDARQPFREFSWDEISLA